MKKQYGLLILLATIVVCFLLSMVENCIAITAEEAGEKVGEAGKKVVETGEKAVEESKKFVEGTKKGCGCGKGAAMPITASLGLLAFIRTRIRKDDDL